MVTNSTEEAKHPAASCFYQDSSPLPLFFPGVGDSGPAISPGTEGEWRLVATAALLQLPALERLGIRLWPAGGQGPGQSDLQLLLPQVPGGEDQTALSLEECLRLLEATCPFGENAEVSRAPGRAH